MSTTRYDATDDPLERRLADALLEEAEQIHVENGWPGIARRLTSPAPGGATERRSQRRRPRPRLVLVAVCSAALVLVLIGWATMSGWRPLEVVPALWPAKAPTTVPRYNASIPNLVVYRTNVHALTDEVPAGPFYLSPELRRTDTADIGAAALNLMFDTMPVHGEPTKFLQGKPDPTKVDRTKLQDWSYWQHVDVTSVTHADGVIRVELEGFSSEIVTAEAAPIMVQAWVHTLQDTLGTRDPVLFRIQGKPFYMYYQVDTTLPIERDDAVPIRHFAGFDSPVDGDVVATKFALLGYADAAPDRPARLEIVNLDKQTKEINDQQISNSGPIDLVQDLSPGRHQITLEGIDASGQPYTDQIVITVVL